MKALIEGKWESCKLINHSQLNGKTYYIVKWGSLLLSFDSSKIKF